jgi:hypothetical protein
MKKYFAKYLPVEEPIKKGDTYYFGPAEEVLICQDEEEAERCNTHTVIKRGSKKVKLFLCSRDIQVGDTFKSNQGLKYEEFFEGKVSKIDGDDIYTEVERVPFSYSTLIVIEGWYKIIGEISPKAKWIKDEDEFDEDEILRTYSCECRMTFRNGEDKHKLRFNFKPTDEDIEEYAKNWAENRMRGFDYTVYWPDQSEVVTDIIKIKCSQCETFH